MPPRAVLLLDTRDRDVAYIGLARGQKVVRSRRVRILGATHRTLTAVRTLTKPGGVSGIVVAHGPGSFTAVRMGVVLANALAFGLGAPVAGVRIPSSRPPSLDTLEELASVSPKRRGIVLPLYDKPPSITHRKRNRIPGVR